MRNWKSISLLLKVESPLGVGYARCGRMSGSFSTVVLLEMTGNAKNKNYLKTVSFPSGYAVIIHLYPITTMLAHVNYGSTKILVNLLYKVHSPIHNGVFIAKILKSTVYGYEKGKVLCVGGFNTLNNIHPLKGDKKNVQWVNLNYKGVPSINDFITTLTKV